MEQNLTTDTLQAGGEVALIVAVTYMITKSMPESWNRFFPFVALGVGVVLALIKIPNWRNAVVTGIGYGAAAMGAYRGTSVVVNGK